MSALPWGPLVSVERSGLTEITHYGLLAVWDNASGEIIGQVGDDHAPIWSRSLLKPWQLLSILPQLKFKYSLSPEQAAIMMSSHNAEPLHQEILNELLAMGPLNELDLQCGACYPTSKEAAQAAKEAGEPPRRLYNGCSGKHLGFLLALKAAGYPFDNYLDPEGPFYKTLRDMLAVLLTRDPESFAVTVDGCRMPNYALSARELAKLYAGLILPLPEAILERAPEHVRQCLDNLGDIPLLMRNHPTIVGGEGRLDTRLIKGGPTTTPTIENSRVIKLVAKEGADGLLGVCVTTAPGYEQGLGVLIKLAEGDNFPLMEQVAGEVFNQLGIRLFPAMPDSGHPAVKTRFHFALPQKTAV